MRISKRVYWVLFVYILAFLADGVLTNHFSKLFLFSGYSLTPRMIIIAVVLLNFMIDQKSMFWFTVVAGFLVDSYYSGVLGVYMALFAVIVRIINFGSPKHPSKSIYIRASISVLLKLHRSLGLLRVCLTRSRKHGLERVLSSETWGNLNVKHRDLLYFISPASQFC